MKIKAPALSESSEKELVLILFIYRYKKSPALTGFIGFPAICARFFNQQRTDAPLSIRKKRANTAILSLLSKSNMTKRDSYRTNFHKIFLLQQKNIPLSTPYSTARIQRH